MLASQLQDLIVATLMRQSSGTQRRWRAVLGPVRQHSRATHAHCNWSFAPSGTERELAIVERLLDDIRVTHPLIDPS